MGKAQYKKKTAAKRHNPIRVPDTHLGSGRAEGKADPAKEKQMLPVLQKLRSAEYADRTWACAAICNLIQNDPATRRLFQGRNVVGELIERLSDSVDEVVVEASGALRNLAIDGGHELCSEMFNKGIMSHLIVLMGKISSTIDSVLAGPQKELSDEQMQARKHLLSLTENVLSLIWSLAEASHKTLAAVNATGCENLLLKVLGGRDSLSTGVALAAAQALYSLTQDNQPFTNAVLNCPGGLFTLVAVVRKDHGPAEASLKGKGKAKDDVEDNDEIGDGRPLLTRVLVAGAVRNVLQPGSPADASIGVAALTNDVILPLANSLLDVNLSNVVDRVTALVAQLPKEEILLPGKDLKTDHRSAPEVKLERVERMLTTVAVALEMVTSMCAGIEDAGDAMDEEGVSGDDDDEMEDALADEDLIAMGRDPKEINGATAAPTIRTTVTLSHLLGDLSLPQRLSALAHLTPLSFPPTGAEPSLHPPTTAALSTVHLRALEALNNLLLTTAASNDASLAALVPAQGVWDAMFGVLQMAGSDAAALTARGHEMRLEIIEAALGCAWGAAKIASAAAALSPQEAHLQMLKDVLPALSSEAAQTRTLDTLATLAARSGVTIEENRAVGTWLMGILTSPAKPELSVAVINAVIDIYADETRDYDGPVFVTGGFLDALAGSVARIRSDVRKVDRRRQPELRARAEEAYENLVAFIKYRRSLRL